MTNVAMTLGYFVLSYLFFHYLRPRHVTILKRIFTALGWVVFSCGVTHGMKALSFAWNAPWTIGMVNAASATLVVLLLLLMIPMIPAIMKFPTASAISRANVELREEISNLLETNAQLATVDNLKAVANITCAIRSIRELSKSQETVTP